MSTFIDKRYYRGKVTQQEMVESRDGFPMLNLYVKLEGMLVDSRRPDSGMLECPDCEVPCVLRFPPDNPDALSYSIADLEKLGFTDEDLGKLAPGHKKHVSFVGRTVYVVPSTRVYNDTPTTYWNLRFPRTLEEKSMEASLISKSKAASAYKEALKKRKEEAVSVGDNGNGDDNPF